MEHIIPSFNKKIFALLLDRAKGERSLRAYALECGISYVQLRKLSLCEQANPPRLALIEKLGAHSQGDVTTEDFAFAAGYSSALGAKRLMSSAVYNKFVKLNERQKREVELYLDFILYRSNRLYPDKD